MSKGQSGGIGGVARRLGSRVKGALASARDTSTAKSSGSKPSQAPKGAALKDKVTDAQQKVKVTQAELDELTSERDRLRARRLELQQQLGPMIGKDVMPRLKVEKTNGTPSFIVGTRMMQRIFARSEDPAAGLDGLGTLFADPAETARYAASHGVPVVDDPATAEATIIAHGLKGQVPLVEVHAAGGVRHFDAEGEDPGDIRPAVTHDASIPLPDGYDDIREWTRVLTRYIPRPYAQTAWVVTSQGPRLVRIDVDPDVVPVLTPEWDKELGLVFDGAYARFIKQPFLRGGLDNRVPGGTFTPKARA